ncbi:sulfatase-like hydrolase/transferase [bacterium]|nr:sulfatase-like hydrolase/transferase [bacterium]
MRYEKAVRSILVSLVAFLPAASSKSDESKRPNVVIIVTDDHGFGDIGWNDPKIKTPTLDRMAAEGCRLDRFYANPICSVTRAALISGVASTRTGVNNRSGLPSKYRTLPQVFKSAGYSTWMVGKWHLGGSEDNSLFAPDYLPQNRGFDHFYGHLHGAIDYYTHERKDLGKLDWQRNGKPVEEKGFSTDLMADEAVRLIETRDATKPFLLYVAFNAVHGPLQAPPSAPDTNRRDKRATLMANVKHMDSAVARIMKAIDSNGIDSDTLVIFFGDNGGQLANGASNGELRGEKGTTFEGGLRVPALIRWPGTIDPGQRSVQFMNVADVLPTLASACGILTGLPDGMDGVDLWLALKSGKAKERPPFVMGYRDTAVFSPPWKLISPGRGEKSLLFEIEADPNETRDVASEHPEIVNQLMESIPRTARPQGNGAAREKDAPAKKKGGERRKRQTDKPSKSPE